ncbi:competence protein CoiA [Cobetia sp. QF-1]|uniref:competence protein CoiA n=1 Tax=Cobetia sp. QF-1 TaxID=1969833 RepID=UPI000B53A1AB|nr:competence protein CoiA family protein [Cobetia sp. QF-1]
MTQVARTHSGKLIYASSIAIADWEVLKLTVNSDDFIMPCCDAPAILKTSINNLPFFAHASGECSSAPETKWHKSGKATVMAALASMGIEHCDEVLGQSSSGSSWKADVLFSINDRRVAIELQRSYQHLRDFIRRQERYAESDVECYWLVRKDVFITLSKATARLLLKRDFEGLFPPGGIGTGMLPELPVAMLNIEAEQLVEFGCLKSATVPVWLSGIIDGIYKYREGSWTLD